MKLITFKIRVNKNYNKIGNKSQLKVEVIDTSSPRQFAGVFQLSNYKVKIETCSEQPYY